MLCNALLTMCTYAYMPQLRAYYRTRTPTPHTCASTMLILLQRVAMEGNCGTGRRLKHCTNTSKGRSQRQSSGGEPASFAVVAKALCATPLLPSLSSTLCVVLPVNSMRVRAWCGLKSDNISPWVFVSSCRDFFFF